MIVKYIHPPIRPGVYVDSSGKKYTVTLSIKRDDNTLSMVPGDSYFSGIDVNGNTINLNGNTLTFIG
jgi:hypothetical protein